MYTEQDVYKALIANNFEVSLIGINNDLNPFFEEINENRPDVIFNLVEVFNNKSSLEKNVAALLEMVGIPYTGATSENMFLCSNKELNRKLFRFHKIKIPYFYSFYRGHKIWLPKKMNLPCIVKPISEEASRGISQASLVENEAALIERVKFIHESMNMDAICEEFVEGRELYVTVMGHKKLTVFSPREMLFGELPEDSRIATYKAKWDENYREKWGIKSVHVGKLADGVLEEIEDVCKRAYRALNIKSYLRLDIRVTADRKIYIIEPNANPCIAKVDEVALSAQKDGISYQKLIKKIVSLALQSESH
ncbi:MAG: ATP-grasp domain-containing protein [Candidatus Omnitrophica bacterium]|nr:ATP-grasp domain-containing protein [Candidatus Omnitrophota bacterium]